MVYNFSAGPSAIPSSVLLQLKSEMLDFEGQGYSLLCTSHRSAVYEEVHTRAIQGIRTILDVPDTHSVLLLAGGASLQFGVIPYCFARDRGAGITITGSWSKKAYQDMKRVASAKVVWEHHKDEPFPKALHCDEPLGYIHYTSNETIEGVQWRGIPSCDGLDTVVDVSSDIGSRVIDLTQYALLYGGTQKNIGIAGLTVVIIRNDLIARIPDDVPAYMNYGVHVEKNSLYNTPPVFAVRALDLVLQWIQSQGGVRKIEKSNAKKANIIYDALDEYPDVYSTVECNRSLMNIVWRLQSEEQTNVFLNFSKEKKFVGLRGHRSIGGIRASLYNAVPLEWAEELSNVIHQFARIHG